jgi:hypothetical protein
MSTYTKFRDYIRGLGISPLEAMDRMQDVGAVSDCAVFLDDCAAVDLKRVVLEKTLEKSADSNL